jgi:hypothetical protein
MKSNALTTWSLRILVWGSGAVFVLLPFHAFLTVWGASFVGHYTLLRLWKEVILLLMTAAAVVLLGRDSKLRKLFFSNRLMQAVGLYALLSFVVGGIAFAAGGVNKTALGDGLLLNLRFLLFFVLTWLTTQKTDVLRRLWRRLLLGPAIAVVAIGLTQRFLLPYDVLKHFGYNSSTIYPYETIDHKRAYLRVQSTLRGANPLGAYLVLIITAALQWLLVRRNRLAPAALIIAADLVLFFSGSRSAMLGTLLSALVLLYVGLPTARMRKVLLLAAATLIVIVAGLSVALRNNDHVQNTVLHTDEHSLSSESSNEGHATLLKKGIVDVLHHPLGTGVGTAGPASVHNNHPGKVAENYFVQIAQEVGWIGFALFAVIYIGVVWRLWQQRQDDDLSLILFASLIGITFVNLLSHAWTDDTLAYIWWGLAGMALAAPLRAKRAK